MSRLVDAQKKFTHDIGQLIATAYARGDALTFGDAMAVTGHRLKSLHYERLAVDFNLFVEEGWVANEHPEWQFLGSYWKSLDPLNRWGGDIVPLRDYNHFSRIADADDRRI